MEEVLGVTLEELEEDLGAAILSRKGQVQVLMEEVAVTFVPEFVLSDDFAVVWQEMEIVLAVEGGPEGGVQARPSSAPSALSGGRNRPSTPGSSVVHRSLSSRGGWLKVLSDTLEDFPLAIQLVPTRRPTAHHGRPGEQPKRGSFSSLPYWAVPVSNARMRATFGRLCDSARGASIDYLDPATDAAAITEVMRTLREHTSCMVGVQCRFQAGPKPSLLCVRSIATAYAGPEGAGGAGLDGDADGVVVYSLVAVVDLTTPDKDDNILRVGNLVKALP